MRPASPLAALACLGALGLAAPTAASAAARLHPASGAGGEAVRVSSFWTPARMRSAPALDASPTAPTATASFAPVPEPTMAPNTVNGRLFLKQAGHFGYCSGTAINTPSRSLVLTAGHCVNTGPVTRSGKSFWSTYMEFVPAYTNGVAPFGAFVAHRAKVFALKQWVHTGNPDYDIGAVVTSPNSEGVHVADAVGGGATIAMNLSRHQEFATFGYPGKTRSMQGCSSPYVGDDSLTYPLPGPPTMAIGCHWAPGASGGGWLIEGGTKIDGLTSYGKRHDLKHTFGPYFSKLNVGRLTAGL
jgi:hypothetical protein